MEKFKKSIKSNFRKFLIVTFGSILVSIGIYFFIMDFNIPLGGVSGLAISIQHLFPNLQVGLVMTIMNIVLFILSYIFLGKEYVGYTLYSSLVVSNFITLLENLIPLAKPLTENILLSMIIGVSISGLGIAIVLTQNATTGGTEIIASIIEKYSNIKIGVCILIADAFVVIFGMIVINVEVGLYAVVGLALNTIVINRAISGLDVKINIVIISNEHKKINEYITSELSRGTTIYVAKGGYLKDNKEVIQTIVSNSEYFKIKNFIDKVDPLAFVTMNYVNEVVGEGFTREIDN